jgi:hypothetical protein
MVRHAPTGFLRRTGAASVTARYGITEQNPLVGHGPDVKPGVPWTSNSHKKANSPRQRPSGTSAKQKVPAKKLQLQHPVFPEQKPPGPKSIHVSLSGHELMHVPLEQHDPGGHGLESEQRQLAACAVGGATQVELSGRHVVPGSQQVRPPVPMHGVRPAGQPQTPLLLSLHAIPDGQHVGPHGVVPAGQQQAPAGLVLVQVSALPQQREPQRAVPAGQPQVAVLALAHATPAGQQLGPLVVEPHGVVPAGQAAASARKGFRTAAATPAASAAPVVRSMRRRGIGSAKPRDRLSKRSGIGVPPLVATEKHTRGQPALRTSSKPSSRQDTKTSESGIAAGSVFTPMWSSST